VRIYDGIMKMYSWLVDPTIGGRYSIRRWFTDPDSTGGFTRISLRGISADTPVIQLEPRSTDEIEVLAEWVRTL